MTSFSNKHIHNRPNRSDRYQYLLVETVCTDEFMAHFDNSYSLEHRLNPYDYDEQVLELQDQLIKRIMKMLPEVLTERQYQVLTLSMEGFTQMEIAAKLGVNQSSITKSLNGNVDYQRDPNGNVAYGGLWKKLRKACANDPDIQDLLNRINELRQERL